MNNSLIQEKKEQPSQIQRHQIEVDLSQGVQVLQAIVFLKDNEHYFTLKKFVLDPAIEMVKRRIERNMKELVKDKDGSIKNAILQDQGFLVATEKFANMEELEKQYKVETERLKTYLRKNGKT